jgi:acyl phosphate:glycerol-3-phosphate acyltransferase
MATLLTTIIGYVLGSIPFGLIAGRLVGGVDVRDFGSGRTGGTNVLRVLGSRWAITTGLLDAAKAALSGMIGYWWGGEPALAAALAAFAAAVGHIYPLFAGFRGGRGVATMLGGLLVISWPAALTASGVALAVIRVTRYVSLGSVLAAASAPLVTLGLLATGNAQSEDLLYAVAIALLVIVSHKDNIQRLRDGTERKLGEHVATNTPGPTGSGASR